MDELIAAGFAADSIHLLSGAEGTRELQNTARPSGLGGLVTQMLRSISDEQEIIEQFENELLEHHSIVAVSAQSDEEKQKIRGIMGRYGGHFIQFFGSWTIETLAN